MANPVFTILFDVMVIGGTAALFAMAIAEARASRRGVVAGGRPARGRPVVRHRGTRTLHRARPARTRGRVAA